MNGLLVAGVVIPVESVDVLPPGSEPWCKLDARDYRRRRSTWVRQIIVHTTKGIAKQHIKPGAGPAAREKVVADFWRRDPEHSAAHIVVGSDGTVACLADVATVAAYHATVSNDWSVGIEVYQEADGGIHEAAIRSAVRVTVALCEVLGIPLQMPGAYRGKPIQRMLDGGRDCVGVFGHRDNTTRRGAGDPGDHIMLELARAGADCFDFDRDEDLIAWQRRQRKLNALGAKLTVDGVAGPSTMDALRRLGFTSGRDVDAA